MITPKPPAETPLPKVEPLRPALRAISAAAFDLSTIFPSGSGGIGGGGSGGGGGTGLGGGGRGDPPPGKIDIILS